ncbi:MAG: T9SS type A sorting domain-containing protein, partial [Bacteroidota bacterium]
IPPSVNCLSILSVQLEQNGTFTLFPFDINDGSFDNCGRSLRLSFGYEEPYNRIIFDQAGTYNVTLVVADEAGNQDSCSTIVYVNTDCENDVIPPNAICADSLYLDYIDTGNPLNADEFDSPYSRSTADNCTSYENLYFSYSPDVTDTIKLFNQPGFNTVELWVTDEAGNQSSCRSTLIVQDSPACRNDDLAPIVICKSTNLQVELDETGTFTLFPEDLDNGSYDDCSDQLNYFLVTSPQGEEKNKIVFDRLGEYITYLKVVDEAGNANFCYTIISVIVDCSNDETPPSADCIFGLNVDVGFVVYALEFDAQSTDNCSPRERLRFSYSSDVTDVSRRFEELGIVPVEIWVTDEAGNQDFCKTAINVKDIRVLNCEEDELLPWAKCIHQLSVPAGSTVFASSFDPYRQSGDACTLYEDLRFSFSSDTNDTNRYFGEAGVFRLEIWVTDEAGNQRFCESTLLVGEDPICGNDDRIPIINCLSRLQVALDETGVVTLFPEDLDNGSYDNCSENLDYFLTTLAGEDINSITYDEPGEYRIYLKVVDEAGNADFCLTTVTVTTPCSMDTSPPVAKCIYGLSVDVSFVVSALEFDDGSLDTCTPSDKLRFSYSSDVDDVTRRFDEVGVVPIELWVTDEAGNQSFCRTAINVIDIGAPNCENDQSSPRASCIDQLIVLVEDQVIASSFDSDRQSGDDCTLYEDLRFSYSSDVTDTSRQFNERGIIPIEIWVTDEAGNQSVCNTRIVVLGRPPEELSSTVEERTSSIAKKKSQIHPSPTKHILNIVSTQSIEQIQIFDLTGRLLYTEVVGNLQQTTQIDAQHLESGTYILRLIGTEYTESLKFIKQ